jgi:CBS domain-containing protein
MRIEDVMTRSVATCRPEDQAAQAARIMWDLDVGCVPVLDDEGDLIGIVTIAISAWRAIRAASR